MIFKNRIEGRSGQCKDNKVFCALWGDWIDKLVGCLEFYDEQSDYLNSNLEDRKLNTVPSFNRARQTRRI